MINNELLKDIWNKEDIEEAKKLPGPILVVGGSGFIGARLFYSLSNCRDDVFACSKYAKQSWRLSFADPRKIMNLNILNFEYLQKVIEELNPKTVFNLSSYGAYSRQMDVEKIHITNYIGALNLVRVLMDSGCEAFLQAGTSSEYGLNCKGPSELDELVPNSDYAASKVSTSYLMKYYGTIFNFPCANLRLYSAFGPWEERDRLIPILIANAQQGKYPHFVNKEISRDFLFIDDCTRAFIRAAHTICKTNPGISVNIASGTKTTLEEVANTAKKIFKITERPKFGSMPNRKWDLADWYGDPSLAKEIMGWESRIKFEEGLRLSADWEKSASKLLKYVSVPTKKEKISAIVACYKDSESIPILHERLTKVFIKSGYDYEIIFVNDSSPNNDENVILQLSSKDTHVIGISHSRNFGSQSAFISGMEASSGNAVVLMDGDGQDPPEVIPQFIKKWEEGNEIVYGERIKRVAPLYMRVLYKLFYRVFKKLSDIYIPLDAGDFSLIDRKAVGHLLQFSEKDVFLRGLRAWVGFRQIGVPYERPERLFGISTNSFQKNIWWAKKGIFSFSTKPLHYIQLVGFLFFVVTLLLGFYYLVNYFIYPPQDARGVTTIVMLVLGLGSIQLISLSIIGDYVGKIVEEVKNRPKYIRNKILYHGKTYEKDQEVLKIIDEIKETGS